MAFCRLYPLGLRSRGHGKGPPTQEGANFFLRVVCLFLAVTVTDRSARWKASPVVLLPCGPRRRVKIIVSTRV